MDETGVLLSDLNTVNVIVSGSDAQENRGVGLRRTMITAIECRREMFESTHHLAR